MPTPPRPPPKSKRSTATAASEPKPAAKAVGTAKAVSAKGKAMLSAAEEGAPNRKLAASKSTGDQAEIRKFATDAARMLADDHCTDVIVLDVRGLSQVTDYLVIGSGTSDRQMRSAADDVEKLADTQGFSKFRKSVDDRTSWVLVDCVDVVVHVFEPNTRAHYDLEMLWGDAQQVEWERTSAPSAGAASRPAGKKRDRAGLGE